MSRDYIRPHIDQRLTERRIFESGDSSGYESSVQTLRLPWKKQEPENELKLDE